MSRPWFTPWGWTYRPTSAAGIAVVALGLAFCANVFWAIDRHSHSVSDTLYGIFPFVVPTLLAIDWIAARSSAGRQG